MELKEVRESMSKFSPNYEQYKGYVDISKIVAYFFPET